MSKVKTVYYCQNCGNQHAKWQGQCNACREWNTLVEEVLQKEDKKDWRRESQSKIKRVSKPLRLADIETSQEERFQTGDQELDRVLGGGLVPGSLTLLGGEPGIGKSTLLLQISLHLNYKTLYVSGEESQQQIKMRAERILPHAQSCYILTETLTQNIFREIEKLQPDILIIDSIQTLKTEYIESSAVRI